MKRFLAVLAIVLMLGGVAYAQDAATEYGALFEQTQQNQDIIEARAVLEDATNVCNETLARMQEIKTSGSFALVPDNLKNAILRWEDMFEDLKAAFLADSEVVDLWQWRP